MPSWLCIGQREQDAYQFLGRYRTSYEQVIGRMKGIDGPRLLCVNTHQIPVDEMVDRVLGALKVVALIVFIPVCVIVKRLDYRTLQLLRRDTRYCEFSQESRFSDGFKHQLVPQRIPMVISWIFKPLAICFVLVAEY